MFFFERYIHEAWIKPFSHPVFGKFCMANFLYAFGSTLLSLAYTFDLASQGLGTVLGFYLAEFILLGAIVMPTLFYLYEKIDRQKWGLLISLIAFCPIIFLPFLENQLVVKSILYSLALSTYWTMFHIYMTKNANYDNKGNDLSVALNTVALGALAGAGLITILAQYGVSFHHISLFGSLFFFLGIYLLNRFEAHAKRLNVAAEIVEARTHLSSRKFLRAVTKDRQRLTNTLMSGFGEIPTNVMWPLWLLVIGYDYTTVGAVAVFTVLLRIGFSGFAGRMANRFPNKALCYGAGMLFCGWVPWIFGDSIALIPLTILTWSIGNHFRSVGLTSQWYDAKSVSSLTAYEATLCAGRVLSILVCVPILMIYPQYYPWIGAGVFLMMALYNFHVRHVAPEPIQVK